MNTLPPFIFLKTPSFAQIIKTYRFSSGHSPQITFFRRVSAVSDPYSTLYVIAGEHKLVFDANCVRHHRRMGHRHILFKAHRVWFASRQGSVAEAGANDLFEL